MRCWFGRITIPDEAISCVESGWTSCIADVLMELDSLDRFDGPEKGEPWIAQKHADSNIPVTILTTVVGLCLLLLLE